MRSILLLAALLCLSRPGRAQDTSVFNLPIQMDAVTVKAARGGWDLAAFIRRVRTDTTFYKAFKGLRIVPWSAVNEIRILDKDGDVRASYFSRSRQAVSRGCRSMQQTDERTTGDFFKRNGDYKWYTAELYAYLFFTKGTVCGDNDNVASLYTRGSGKIEKAKFQLKQLIFNPGAKIDGIPLIGDKASVFDPDIARRYDFKLLSVDYGGTECYLFRALPKPEYADDVVYNELSTWFRKSDYAILARDYSLSYKTLIYDFDVRMKVRLQPVGARLLPVSIEYTGDWRVATQGRERAKFAARFSY